ncbi:DUF6290 family protein [Desulfonatronospira sp. MSAO_Bac3]|uniref:DUF6290 family protein n=1 Tax=Desulfonatronospira sp. MSAO_Bac3 TaxID=2293857 RepID=UPI000FF5AD36|nr:DUF6290 family protein [Desulfonatronospira sp. MSAO_Bac3]RQD75973.1 MAG: ribbon-helix-helix protein, CopG family [Desulfonatronospira sp. MSAO_Bac3]
MKTITINVSSETYHAFQEYAARNNRTASELIRNAMEEYRRSYLREDQSIFDAPPANAGSILKDLTPEDDLLQEMLE